MQVICNHVADPRIVLKPNAGSDRSWVWNAFDFTEGELEEITFALRFGNSDFAKEFKEASSCNPFLFLRQTFVSSCWRLISGMLFFL